MKFPRFYYIKKLDRFIIKAFLKNLMATFFICLFIFIIQLMWKWIDEFVDKGANFVRKKAVGSLYTKINNIKETLSAMINETGAVDWNASTNKEGHKAPEYVDRKHVLFLF